jgi:hypothetical protein
MRLLSFAIRVEVAVIGARAVLRLAQLMDGTAKEAGSWNDMGRN